MSTLRQAKASFERGKQFTAYIDFWVQYQGEQGTFAVRFGFDRAHNAWECTMS